MGRSETEQKQEKSQPTATLEIREALSSLEKQEPSAAPVSLAVRGLRLYSGHARC